MSRTNTTFRHFTLSFLGLAFPVLLQLLTVPLFLRAIGAERYAVLTLIWLLLGNFSFFDLGFGRALANRLAGLGDDAPDRLGRIFWTATGVSLAAGIVGGAILAPVCLLVFQHALPLPSSLRQEFTGVPPLLALALPITTLLSVLSGALQGRQRFLALNAGQTLGTALYQILPLALALTRSTSLPGLIAMALAGRLISVLVLLVLCLRHLPGLRRNVGFDGSEARALLRYGGWITVAGMLSPLLWAADRFFIGLRLNIADVTTYTIPCALIERATIIPNALQAVLFPRFSGRDGADAGRLLAVNTRVMAATATIIVTAGLLLLRPFLDLWLGRGFADAAAPLGEVLLLGLWFYLNSYLPLAYLQGRGQPDLAAKIHIAETLLYLPALWAVVGWSGMAGAAWMWSARFMIYTGLLFRLSGLRPLLPWMTLNVLWVGAVFILLHLSAPGLGLRISGCVLLALVAGLWLRRSGYSHPLPGVLPRSAAPGPD